MKIVWKKEQAQQDGKVIDVETTLDRFYLYPIIEKVNMWCLYDSKTETQHYIFREKAEPKIKEILSNENKSRIRK
jgi:hypothetical protein